MRCALAAAAVAILGLGSAAAAATLDLSYFDRSQAGAAQAALAAFQAGADDMVGPNQRMTAVRTETFEGYRAWDGRAGASNPSDTAVGSFATLGGAGFGGSSVNGGTALQVRNDDPWKWGRHKTGGVDGNWLDSNDTKGIRWNVSGGGAPFNALAFVLTDVADVGAMFSIRVGETVYSQAIGAAGRKANGSIHLVRILLPEPVDSLIVNLRNDRLNDGFGIDSATIAHIAPVPVPPAALLLLSGSAVLVGLRRRRRAA